MRTDSYGFWTTPKPANGSRAGRESLLVPLPGPTYTERSSHSGHRELSDACGAYLDRLQSSIQTTYGSTFVPSALPFGHAEEDIIERLRLRSPGPRELEDELNEALHRGANQSEADKLLEAIRTLLREYRVGLRS